MAAKNLLKHGFKAHAERLAKSYREKLNIHPCGALCAFELAKNLNISVFEATDFLSEKSDIDCLSGSAGNECEWSALTMKSQAGNQIIIYNPFHSEPRRQSDVMHELAHIICDHRHEARDSSIRLPIGMRDYNALQEEEAICLGSTLQLAKPCLLWAKKRDMTSQEIAIYFNSSIEMVKFRLNMTGIGRMIGRPTN